MAPGYRDSGGAVPVSQDPRPSVSSPLSPARVAGGDDPLPAIEGLQVSGEAFPGQTLQACGYSINGTTMCHFAWLRCSEDGSTNYIEEAKEPIYLVTTHDVGSYLGIEVRPMDNRNREVEFDAWEMKECGPCDMGETVRVFANGGRKITYG